MADMKRRRRTAFNLPPSWSPSLAYPQNVINEGLQRHGLVTQQEPDGTFDNPAVGTAGYAVPEYIVREGYGRGAYVTKWAPRGTYYGPGLPDWLNYPVSAVDKVQRLGKNEWRYTMDSLHGDGDDALESVTSSYGFPAADTLISSVKRLPPSQRTAALKSQMAKIDRSLPRRCEAIAKRLQRVGYSPADALRHGLARAMSAGLVAETVKSGQRAVRGQRRGAMGYLGGLGADAPSGPVVKGPSASTQPTCYNPPPGFTWSAATSSVPGHWERVRVGQAPSPAPEGCYTLTGARSGTQGGVTVTGGAGTQLATGVSTKPKPMIQVGPWLFPADFDSYITGPLIRDHRTGTVVTQWQAIPSSWQREIASTARRLLEKGKPSIAALHGMKLGLAFTPVDALGLPPASFPALGTSSAANPNFFLSKPGWLPLRMFRVMWEGQVLNPIPIFRTIHPINKREYGVYLRGAGSGDFGGIEYPPGTTDTPGYGASLGTIDGRPYAGGGASFKHGSPRVNGPLVFEWAPVPPPADRSWWEQVKSAITFVPAVLHEIPGAIGDVLSDLACAVLNNSVGQAGVQAAAASQGVPPQVSGAGTQLAAQAAGCKVSDQTPPVVPAPPQRSYLLPLAIGGAAIGAAYLISRRK